MDTKNKEELIREFKSFVQDVDKILRPHVIFLNPDDAATLRASKPDIEDEYVIHEFDYIEKGKGFLFEREEIENWKAILYSEQFPYDVTPSEP